MNVFLAGKVDERFGSWRDEILGKGSWNSRIAAEMRQHEEDQVAHHLIQEALGPKRLSSMPRWVTYVPYKSLWGSHEWDDFFPFAPWPVREGIVLGLHAYTGPYRQVALGDGGDTSCSGYFHGVESIGNHGCMDEPARRLITEACRKAIEASDLVFAFINSPDAYGTVAEIGYAVALKKFVALCVPQDVPFENDDFWYVAGLCNHVTEYYQQNVRSGEGGIAKEALRDALVATTAREPMPASLPVMTTRDDRSERAIREIARSFQQIARWTSDPRVRGEAQRMLDAMGAG